MINKYAKVTLLFLSVVFMLGIMAACGEDASSSGGDAEASDGDTVKIGALFDITGGTGDVGTPYADGEKAFFEYLNSQGGIDGVHVDLSGDDYAYDMAKGQRLYQELRDKDKVSAILGWGTADTEALRQQVANDKLPYFSASYSENLKDLDESPYNFLTAATYSDQGRAVLKWISENHEGSNPTLALLYNDTAFGQSPIEDIKEYAAEVGVEVVDEQVIPVTATEAQSQMLNMEEKNPDYAIIQQTWGATATILREAQTLGSDTQFIGLNWATGEGVVEIAGDAAEGMIGVVTHAFPYEDLEGLSEIEEYLESKGESLEDVSQKFIQGWVTAKIMSEGISNAEELNGEGIRKGIEQIKDLDLGGLAAPVSFSEDNHAGTNKVRLAEVKNGQFEVITDYFSYED
ncbi:branched-chain amino acid transport system substrate-binding protein [Halobacillus dabanensis]|uniref:Branched-chain amino acid transport system substrate-binding protein n=1 Tax=Halobacillus dabanensis TaxID=240302 RepID=A0A1I3XVA2_HALDA|nr:ABC transporter substrate-binding protein [Halobacillus dabanensis]SFK23432.1 branched-chain amino acid transport system substrate-binding protein [Halobacillus dabanensis]